MKKAIGLLAVLAANSLLANQTVVSKSFAPPDAGDQYAQVCVTNPTTSPRRVSVQAQWDMAETPDYAVLPPGATLVFRLTYVGPTAPAQLAVRFRKTLSLATYSSTTLTVPWTTEATDDCSKLPSYQFVCVGGGPGCEMKLDPVSVPVM